MSTDRPTRRSFLQGASAVRELAGVVALPSDFPSPADDRSSFIVSVHRRAMACEFEVQLAANRNDNSMEHVFEALDLVESIESQLTVYRDDSEVIRINLRAAREPVKIEERLFALLQQARRLHRETNGALDITSGPLSDVWGFSRREGRIPSDDQIADALRRVGMQHVILDETEKTIAFAQPGLSVNFNSMGKGYALDRMAERLAEYEIDDYLLHGGKSSILARGTQPASTAAGWRVGIRHPLRPAERLAELILHNEALSTSGAGTQFFIRRGRRYGHILDPRSGYPAKGLYSATVMAPIAAEAEGLSTAFYVMGPERVSEFCIARPEIAALLVAPGEREGDIRLIAFGLDDKRLQLPRSC
ncbi:MAG TPA: FAD:protein FMN transferase [Lacipirellulaceae bacterium]|nr:FAD:protein FMN transferase [Lacipirellulaceae bacterium]